MGKVIQGCMEDAGDVVKMTNSARGMQMGGYGAPVNSAENFNLSALRD